MTKRSLGPAALAICCYCGARSTLPAPGRRAALVCHGCGAPLRVIEALEPAPSRKPAKGGAKGRAIPHPAEERGRHLDKDRPARRRKGKRRPGLWRRMREAFDDLDDLDDLLDIFD